MKKTNLLLTVCMLTAAILHLTSYNSYAQATQSSFTQADRERIIRIEEQLKAMQKLMDTRFEAVDKRFEAVDKHFESLESRMNNMMLLFGGLVAAVIGFAIWDRRTMIRPFETKVKEMDIAIDQIGQERTANKILTALRELAKKDTPLAEVLRTYNLL